MVILINCFNPMKVMVVNLLLKTATHPMNHAVMKMCHLPRLLGHRWSQIVLQKLTGGFALPDVNFQREQVESYQDARTHVPLVYMLENIVAHTNQHSVQKHGKCVNTSVKEIEQVLGMYLRMGLVQMFGARQYWESEVHSGPVADIMSRNQFNLLLSHPLWRQRNGQ